MTIFVDDASSDAAANSMTIMGAFFLSPISYSGHYIGQSVDIYERQFQVTMIQLKQLPIDQPDVICSPLGRQVK
jgi:hypothetical protein